MLKLFFIQLLLLFPLELDAQISKIKLRPVPTGGLTQPVYVTSPADETRRLFILEQPGRVALLVPGASVYSVFLGSKTESKPSAAGSVDMKVTNPGELNSEVRRFAVVERGMDEGSKKKDLKRVYKREKASKKRIDDPEAAEREQTFRDLARVYRVTAAQTDLR